MIGLERAWRSPLDGSVLRHDGPHSLADATTRWPVVAGIPYLRVGRDALRTAVLEALDAGDIATALVHVLGDRDDWASGDAADPARLRDLVQRPDAYSYREALDALAFGPVATYFAHRWSDPTFLAGLALLAAHRPLASGTSFEVACGTGHYLRELLRAGVDAAGGDVVFAKLWLARRYVAPAASLVCFDVAHPWPPGDGAFGLVHCHDALYFFSRKAFVAREMRRIASDGAALLVSHAHNCRAENLSAGEPLDVASYAAMFDARFVYDDRELTQALVECRVPRPEAVRALDAAQAIAWAAGSGACEPRAIRGDVAEPPAGTPVRINPLYRFDTTGRRSIAWPSARYEAEYAAFATYPADLDACPADAVAGESPFVDALARRRAYVALPTRW